jgi:hypothetical protein
MDTYYITYSKEDGVISSIQDSDTLFHEYIDDAEHEIDSIKQQLLDDMTYDEKMHFHHREQILSQWRIAKLTIEGNV